MPVISSPGFTISDPSDNVLTGQQSLSISTDGIVSTFNIQLDNLVHEISTVTVQYVLGGVSYTVENTVTWNELSDSNVSGTISDDNTLNLVFTTAPDAGSIDITFTVYTYTIRTIEAIFRDDVNRQLYYMSYTKGQEEVVDVKVEAIVDDIVADLTDNNGSNLSMTLTEDTSLRRLVAIFPPEEIRITAQFKLPWPLTREGTIKIHIF